MKRVVSVVIGLLLFLAPASVFAMPLPAPGVQVWQYGPTVDPSTGPDPGTVRPVAAGPVAAGGGEIRIQIAFETSPEPVDVYVGILAPELGPDLLLVGPGPSLHTATSGLVPWRSGVSGPLADTIFGGIPFNDLPAGTYTLYGALTPAGRLDAMYLWATSFVRYPLAFVTTASGNANLGTWPDAGGATGIDAGDAICNTRAAAAGLPGIFAAWLSDDVTDAYCHIQALPGKRSANCGEPALPGQAGPWVRMDGYPLGDSIEFLVSPAFRMFAPIFFDENGAPAERSYFTNTQPDGSAEFRPCSGWAGDSTSDGSLGGDHMGTAVAFTASWGSYCSATASLACFERGVAPPLSDFSRPGKVAFLTSAAGPGDLSSWTEAGAHTGLAAGDAICQTLAASAGISNAGAFKAWLSDGTVGAIDRFASDGPWVRLDGVPIAESRADLSDGSNFTAINVNETGTYVAPAYTWTGTTKSGSATGASCGNWSDGSTVSQGTRGISDWSSGGWSDWGEFFCDSHLHLYCFED